MDRLRRALAAGEFVVTSEVGPPKGTDLSGVIRDVETHLKGRVYASNVTDGQAAVMRMASMPLCRVLLDHGHEPVMQVTVRDRNRMALQADLLGAHALGIRNVLVLTGDPIHIGDHPDAKPVNDLDAGQLLAAVKGLNEGRDLAGKELTGKTDFFIAAAATPEAKDLDLEMAKMAKKVECGAAFFQTQAVFDPDRFAAFMERAKVHGRPVLAGVIILKSGKMARFMNEKIPGIRVPEEMIAELDAAKDKRAKGIEVAARMIRALRPHAQGIHLMPIGWDDTIPAILEAAGYEPGPTVLG